ncbi:acyl-CoA thioesterase [Nocardioides pocheonensis]|uniref:Acyl-CoA thioesterase n=1 Tax=Nocardioides pocheonensis TaxID=661485 RepID=A0A3N0GIN7_9ACTN|nr:thioesterase family protein [Nocardioides pocheonensis]RNM12032.1 acyl-CoA thioesterase [Nocardioides pocheonensis]
MRRVLEHRVRYHEADAQGFLFNSRYLELADVAMTEFFRALGFPYGHLVSSGADPSVVKAGVEFRRPARFDEVLDIAVACTRVGQSSFDLAMVVSRAQDVVAEMLLTYVNVDARNATSRLLPDGVAQALRSDQSDNGGNGLEIHQ